MADQKSDEGEWRLASGSGEPVSIDDWDLAGGLSSGDIRPDAWVWKRGWAEWLRAREVESLRTALPEKLRAKVKTPRLGPHDAEPPRVPHATVHTPIPYTPSQENLPRIAHVSEAVEEELFRSPASTLVDRVEAEVDEGGRTTLKPPGAVPPPPRGVPKPSPVRRRLDTPIPETAASAETTDEDAAAVTERDDEAATAEQGDDTIEDSDPAPTRSLEGSGVEGTPQEKAKTHEPEAARPRRLSDRPEHTLDATLPAASGFRDIDKASTTQRLMWVIAGLASLCAILMATIVLLLLKREDETVAQPAPSAVTSSEPIPSRPVASASASTPSPPAPVDCQLVGEAQKLADTAALNVPVNALAIDPTAVAVGFAASRTHAIGLKVSWPALEVETVFEKRAGPALLGVVPITASGELQFVTDRVNAPLRSAHSLNSDPRITLGSVAAGLAEWTRGRKPRVVWPAPGNRRITVPRTASSEQQGTAVTFRRGRRKGDVMLGWISQQGEAKGQLRVVDKPGQLAGTPSVATNGERVLVAFANRAEQDQPWQIVAGSAPLGEAPEHARPIAGLPIAKDATALSPVVAGLRGGAWLLQWTEGSAGSYRVRVQVLNQALEPIAEPLDTSPKDKTSGQGTLWAEGERALSLYIVTRGTAKELWARSIRCP